MYSIYIDMSIEVKDIPDIGLTVSGIIRDRNTIAMTALEEWLALEEKHRTFMLKWSDNTPDGADVNKNMITKMGQFMTMINHKRDECYVMLSSIISQKSIKMTAKVDKHKEMILFDTPLKNDHDFIIITTPCKYPVVINFKNDTHHYRTVINNYKCVSLPKGEWSITVPYLPIRKLVLNIF